MRIIVSSYRRDLGGFNEVEIARALLEAPVHQRLEATWDKTYPNQTRLDLTRIAMRVKAGPIVKSVLAYLSNWEPFPSNCPWQEKKGFSSFSPNRLYSVFRHSHAPE